MELDDGEAGNAIQLGGNIATAPPNPYPVLDRTPNICAPPKTYTTVLNNPTAPGVLTADPVPLAGDSGHAPTAAQEVTETKVSEAAVSHAVSHAPEGHKDKKRKKDKVTFQDYVMNSFKLCYSKSDYVQFVVLTGFFSGCPA